MPMVARGNREQPDRWLAAYIFNPSVSSHGYCFARDQISGGNLDAFVPLNETLHRRLALFGVFGAEQSSRTLEGWAIAAFVSDDDVD